MKPVLTKIEECHANHDGCAFYAYFKGTPTKEDLKACECDDITGVDEMERVDDVVSVAAGLERWFIGIPV